jgi:hypothetical protein
VVAFEGLIPMVLRSGLIKAPTLIEEEVFCHGRTRTTSICSVIVTSTSRCRHRLQSRNSNRI